MTVEFIVPGPLTIKMTLYYRPLTLDYRASLFSPLVSTSLPLDKFAVITPGYYYYLLVDITRVMLVYLTWLPSSPLFRLPFVLEPVSVVNSLLSEARMSEVITARDPLSHHITRSFICTRTLHTHLCWMDETPVIY